MTTINYQKNYITQLKTDIKNNLFQADGKFLNKYIAIKKKKWFEEKNLINLYSQILQIVPDELTDNISEKIYLILNNLSEKPTCECGTILDFEFYSRGYREYCSKKCRANSSKWKNLVKSTNNKVYGSEFASQNESVKNKIIKKLKISSRFVKCSKDERKAWTKKTRSTIKKRYGQLNPGWNSKAVSTRLKNKNLIPVEDRSAYSLYKLLVKKHTQRNIKLFKIVDIEKRNNHAIDENAYHIDHIFSIYDGFMYNIPSYIIGDVVNLQCIPYMNNLTKNKNSMITVEQLIERYFNNEKI